MVMTDAPPVTLSVRRADTGRWYQSLLDPPEPDAVLYVRADLYEALQARAQQEPVGELGTDYR